MPRAVEAMISIYKFKNSNFTMELWSYNVPSSLIKAKEDSFTITFCPFVSRRGSLCAGGYPR